MKNIDAVQLQAEKLIDTLEDNYRRKLASEMVVRGFELMRGGKIKKALRTHQQELAELARIYGCE